MRPGRWILAYAALRLGSQRAPRWAEIALDVVLLAILGAAALVLVLTWVVK